VRRLGKVLGDEHADVLRESVRMILGELMEAEVAKLAGAERYEHSPERVAQRNGYRERAWDTRVGSLELAIPRLRTGSYMPSFLEPRRREWLVTKRYLSHESIAALYTPRTRSEPLPDEIIKINEQEVAALTPA
jgi:transposase-like protein